MTRHDAVDIAIQIADDGCKSIRKDLGWDVTWKVDDAGRILILCDGVPVEEIKIMDIPNAGLDRQEEAK